MSPVLELSLAEEVLPAGVARALVLGARNDSPGFVLLDAVTVEPGSALFAPGPSFTWRRRADGVILYDAAWDHYVHSTQLLGVAAVPLHVGVLPPGARAETVLPVRLARSARVSVTVSFAKASSLEGRVYSSPQGVAGETVIFSPGFAPGPAIVREDGLERGEARLEIDVEVAGEVEPGAIARSRALGWVAAGPSIDGHAIDGAVLDLMDIVWPGEPFVVLFRGERAEGVRRALGVDLNPARQGLVPYERARELIREVAAKKAWLRVGLPWEGFVVE